MSIPPVTPAIAETLAQCRWRYGQALSTNPPLPEYVATASHLLDAFAKVHRGDGAPPTPTETPIGTESRQEIAGWMTTLAKWNLDTAHEFKWRPRSLFPDEEPHVGAVPASLAFLRPVGKGKNLVSTAFIIHLDTRMKRDLQPHRGGGTAVFSRPGKIKQIKATSLPHDLRARWMAAAARELYPDVTKYRVGIWYANGDTYHETGSIDGTKIDEAMPDIAKEMIEWHRVLAEALSGESEATPGAWCPGCQFVNVETGGDGQCPYWRAQAEEMRRTEEFQRRAPHDLGTKDPDAEPPPPPNGEFPTPIKTSVGEKDGGQHQGINYWRTNAGWLIQYGASLTKDAQHLPSTATRADVCRAIEERVEETRAKRSAEIVAELARLNITAWSDGGLRAAHVGVEVEDDHALYNAICFAKAPAAVIAQIHEWIRCTGWTLVATVPGDKIRAKWEPGEIAMLPGVLLPPPGPPTEPEPEEEEAEEEPEADGDDGGNDDNEPEETEVADKPKPMIKFRSPKADATIKLLIAGPPKCFKTRAVMKAFAPDPKKITLAVADLDNGTAHYPDEFGFRRFEVEDPETGRSTIPTDPDIVLRLFEQFTNNLGKLGPDVNCLAVDPMSVLVELLKTKWALILQAEYKRTHPVLAMADWQMVYGELNRIMSALRQATHHCVVVSHIKDLYDKKKKKTLNDVNIIGETADAGRNAEAWFDAIVYVSKDRFGRMSAQTIGDRSNRLPSGTGLWDWDEDALAKALFGGGVEVVPFEEIASDDEDEAPTTKVTSIPADTQMLPGLPGKTEVAHTEEPTPEEREMLYENSDGVVGDPPAPETEPAKPAQPLSAEEVERAFFERYYSNEKEIPHGNTHPSGRGVTGTVTPATIQRVQLWVKQHSLTIEKVRSYARAALNDPRINSVRECSEEEVQKVLRFMQHVPF